LEKRKAAKEHKKNVRLSRKTKLFDDTLVKAIEKIYHEKKALPKGTISIGDEFIHFLVIDPNNPHNALIRVSDKSWRDGYWFYNFLNKKQLRFEKDVHKPGYGDAAIDWSAFYKHMENSVA